MDDQVRNRHAARHQNGNKDGVDSSEIRTNRSKNNESRDMEHTRRESVHSSSETIRSQSKERVFQDRNQSRPQPADQFNTTTAFKIVCITITAVVAICGFISYSRSSEIDQRLKEIEAIRAKDNRAFEEFERFVREWKDKALENAHKNDLVLKDLDQKLHDMNTNLEFAKQRIHKTEEESASIKQKLTELESVVRDANEKLQETAHKNELMQKESSAQTTVLITHFYGLLENERQRKNFCRTFVGIRIPSILELGYCGSN